MIHHHRLVLRVLGMTGWFLFALVTAVALARGPAAGGVFQVDWHVSRLGLDQLLDRTLYRTPLNDAGLVVSTPIFNLPPLLAAWAAPLAPLPLTVGGHAWQLVGALGVVVAGLVAADRSGVRRPMAVAGIALGVLSVTPLYVEGLHLATNNYLVLGLVAGVAYAYLRGHHRWAGALLGLAIATKLWPATLLVVALRDGRWTTMRWAIGAALLGLGPFFAWLGTDAIAAFATALRTQIPPTGYLIGPTAVDGLRPVWNAGLGWAVTAGLLLLPARGATGLGVAILAGLAPIANLWIHYAPTVLFAVALVLVGLSGHLGHQRAVAEQPPA